MADKPVTQYFEDNVKHCIYGHNSGKGTCSPPTLSQQAIETAAKLVGWKIWGSNPDLANKQTPTDPVKPAAQPPLEVRAGDPIADIIRADAGMKR